MKERGKVLVYTLLGNAMIAFAVCAIAVPHGIMMGGSSGIALALNHFVPVRLSVLSGGVCVALFGLGLYGLEICSHIAAFHAGVSAADGHF